MKNKKKFLGDRQQQTRQKEGGDRRKKGQKRKMGKITPRLNERRILMRYEQAIKKRQTGRYRREIY